MITSALDQKREDAALCRYALHVAATLADAARRGDHDAIREVLGRLPAAEQPEPIVAVIQQAARAFEVTVADIKSPSRVRQNVDARGVVCYAARLLGYTFATIGGYVNRDHSTAVCAYSRVGESPRLRGIAQRIAQNQGWDREALGA